MGAQAEAAARLLVERFGVTRVVLLGSVALGKADERSDLDLAVEGLEPRRYFEALGALCDVAPGDGAGASSRNATTSATSSPRMRSIADFVD